MDAIEKLKVEILNAMCTHCTAAGLDARLHKPDVYKMIPNSPRGHIDLALQKLVDDGKVMKSSSMVISNTTYSVDYAAYANYLKPNGESKEA